MSNDLISRRTLINHLNDYAFSLSPLRDGESGEAYNAVMECIKGIEDAPTAYDVDKVVEKLEREPELVIPTNHILHGKYIKKSRAIKIVKAGGKNETN